jgi:glucokinase
MHWGIDIGGTTTIIGYLIQGQFVKTATLATDPASGPESLLNRICTKIREVDDIPGSIGAGIAGLVDREKGLLVSSPNLEGWDNFRIRDRLSGLMHCPVAIDNDCNVFAIKAIESSEIPSSGLWLMVTLGTGIGGTIINDGTILYGSSYAGEFGHMTVEASGNRCPCGSKGCWETYAAAGALSGYYSKYSHSCNYHSPIEIAQMASSKDEAALEAFREFGKWLGIGLVNLYQCFSPCGIYLGGGLPGASDFFLEYAEKEFRRRCRFDWNVNVLTSSSDAGAEGAAIMGSYRTE